jgi:C4-dicarboxylate transporter DctQ subunit
MSVSDEGPSSGSPSRGTPPDARPTIIRLYDAFTKRLFMVSMLVMLLGMTLVIGFDVILRMGFGQPIRGAHDLVGLSMLMLFVLGLPHSWRAGHHVRMDMIYRAMPDDAARVVDIFAGLAAFVFAGMLAYQAFVYVPSLMSRGSGSMLLKVPYWPFAIAIGVSSILFAVAILMDLYMSVTGRQGRSS